MEENPPRVKDILPEALYVHSVIRWSCCHGKRDVGAMSQRKTFFSVDLTRCMNYANHVDFFYTTGEGDKSTRRGLNISNKLSPFYKVVHPRHKLQRWGLRRALGCVNPAGVNARKLGPTLQHISVCVM